LVIQEGGQIEEHVEAAAAVLSGDDATGDAAVLVFSLLLVTVLGPFSIERLSGFNRSSADVGGPLASEDARRGRSGCSA
jgi:hypothetical protein